MDQVGRDPELRTAWERYYLIGQALRHEAVNPAGRRVADAIGVALLSEPIPMRRRPSRTGSSPHLAPFGGAALAAAVAFLAVFAVPKLFQGPESEPPQSLVRQAAIAAPASGAAGRRWDLVRPDVASKLDLYLVNHQESAPATGVKGMLPYATLIGYEVAR